MSRIEKLVKTGTTELYENDLFHNILRYGVMLYIKNL